MYKLIIVFFTAAMLTGCADFRLQKSLLDQDAGVDTNCRNLTGYYEDFSGMDREERREELILSTEAWLFDSADCNQLRLALILSHPENPAVDQKKALKLLNELLEEEDEISNAERQLARLVKDQMDQTQVLQRRNIILKEKFEQVHEVSGLRLKRLTDLESQLEQLKNIEENINEMEQAIITPVATDNGSNESAQNPAGR